MDERRRSTDAEIESLKELMVVKFDNLFREVLETQRLQRETNGRLRTVEGDIANVKPRVSTLEREMGEVRETGGENRSIKAWHIYYGIACVALTVAVLKFFGRL